MPKIGIKDYMPFRTILQVPTYTAVEFLRGEVGASSMMASDIKFEIIYLRHSAK